MSAPRVASAVVAAVAFAAGCAIAFHHPLAPALAPAIFVLWSIAVYLRPAAWLFAVPALLPVIDLAPWTGWLTLEEFDLVVLGAIAGGYTARIRPSEAAEHAPRRAQPRRLLALALVGLYGASLAVALVRGVLDAGALELGWTTGYYDALNGARVAKSFFFVALLAPLLRVELARAGAAAFARFALGCTCALGLEALAVVWERVAFPGLLNFSSDYRVTGLFWEMHVGGAALDGFLALAFPFALLELARARNTVRWTLAAAITALATYACLATFSRGLYAAVPVGVAVLALGLVTQREAPSPRALALAAAKACALIAAVAAASYLVFRTGGYRALLAVLAVLAAALAMMAVARGTPARVWWAGLGGGALAAGSGLVVATAIPRGPYVLLAAAFVACALLVARARRSPAGPLLPAAFVWLVFAAAAVARHWGGDAAFADSALVLALLATFTVRGTVSSAVQPAADLRTQGGLFGAAVLIALAVAVFSGGAYMTDRAKASESDLDARIAHWRAALAMLDGPGDLILGKGLGRFPQNYLFRVRDGEAPGSYAIATHAGKHHLVLSGPGREDELGGILRVGQRIALEPGTYSAVLDLRALQPARLHVEICARHLLYRGACASAAVDVPAGEAWTRRVVELDGRALSEGAWYAPRLGFFALLVETPERVVEIGHANLVGPDGRSLLADGDFATGMTRWFSTSDRLHLPWHLKSVFVDALFEQGVVGLLLFTALAAGALWRVASGRGWHDPAAPALAASLAAFLVVGAFDGLQDVPRVAFLFYLVAAWCLLLPEALSRGRAISF